MTTDLFTPDLDVSDRPPTPTEFITLRETCGWGLVPEDVAVRALSGGLLDVTVRRAGRLIGFGRVVGDGALYFYVQDVIVVPDARGEGIGSLVMERLMTRLHEAAPRGATLGLMAAQGKERFYERFGFAVRPADRYGAGMTQFVP